jgi:hypothetical protein
MMRTHGTRWGLLDQDRRRQLLRLVLWSLAASSLAIGLFAALTPRSFYGHVVGVDLLPPFNQHLLSDVGGFYLGFAVLLSWAAITLGRELVAATCAAWTLTQTLHFLYHGLHLENFSVGEAALQTALLALLLSGPLFAALLMRSDPTRDPGGRHSDRL